MADANELLAEVKCYGCLGLSIGQLLKLALLRRQLLALDSEAATDVDSLLDHGKCFQCHLGGDVGRILELSLLDKIAAAQPE